MVDRPGFLSRARIALAELIGGQPRAAMSGDAAAMRELFGDALPSSGVPVTERSALQLTVALACIRLLASIPASLDLRVEELKEGTWQPVASHPVGDFLDAPNAQDTDYTCLERLHYGLQSQGNGICRLWRRGSYRPYEAQPLARENVARVFRGRDRRLKYHLIYRDLADQDRNEVVDQDFVLHVPGIGFDGYWSPSPITYYAKEALGLALASQQFSGVMFRDGAKPAGAISFPPEANEEAVERTKKLVAKYKGVSGAGAILPLVGAEWKTISFTAQEAELIQSRTFSIEDISRVWGVPLHLINASQKTTSWGTGMQEQTLAFMRYTLGPHMVRVERELNRKLFRNDERGRLRVRHNAHALMRGTPAQQIEMLELATGGPIMTTNEGRADVGLPPIDGGDTLREPRGASPAKSSTPAAEPIHET